MAPLAPSSTPLSCRPYDAVLFDWDGCLAKTLPIWMAAFRHAFAQFSLAPSDAEIAAQFGNMVGHLDMGITQADSEAYVAHLLDHVDQLLPGVDLYDGALDVLLALREEGVPTALVTTSRRRHLEEPLARHGIAERFDAIVTAEDVEQHKPHPEPVLRALEQLGVDADRAVMVGDTLNDLGAAAAAGTGSALMLHPEHEPYYDFSRLLTGNPTHVCGSFKELLGTLLPTIA